MTPEQIQAWMAVVSAAMLVGSDLVDAVKNHARQTLSDADYATLESAWQDDVARTAANAGIPVEPDVPLPTPPPADPPPQGA